MWRVCITNLIGVVMRTEFVACGSYHTAKRRCPWAAVIARTWDGFIAFESVYDYYVWNRQR